MIEYKTGNILREDVDAIVNTVNCVGVMGRGIALQFKNEFPENFKAYAEACKKGEVIPGRMFVFETKILIRPKFIINFPTKRHWKGKSRMEDIHSGLKDLVDVIRKYKIDSIAVPPLGCGLGGLNWSEVKASIEAELSLFDNVHIVIYEPKNSDSPVDIKHIREVPKMTAGRAAIVELIHRYLGGLLDPFVSLLEIHKLLYFMQEAGEPLKLKFQKAAFGPYAENLRHVLNAIEGHLISGYVDGGDSPYKQIKLVPGAIQEATTFLVQYKETRARFEKVSDLVEGFESPFGLELLSTVYWIMKNEQVSSLDDVIRCCYDWNDRKKDFSIRQISLALDVLVRKGWVAKMEMN